MSDFFQMIMSDPLTTGTQLNYQTKYGEVHLCEKPNAAIWTSYVIGDPASDTLVIFLNGLLLPRTSWHLAMNAILNHYRSSHRPCPTLLCYDRYGQGDSDPDPADTEARPAHDLTTVVTDLHALHIVFTDQLSASGSCNKIVLVANSIGCALARLYASTYPGTVSGIVFLDSIITNTDFVSLFPNPDAPGFAPSSLPAGVTELDVRRAREIYERLFHPSVLNPERLDRSNLVMLLPESDRPILVGPNGKGVLITVVGHDWDTFAADNKVSVNITSRKSISVNVRLARTVTHNCIEELRPSRGNLSRIRQPSLVAV